MTQINPLTGSILQAPGVQKQQSEQKSQQLRRAADVLKNAGLMGDRFEHAVESPEALAPIHDEQKNDAKKRRQQHKPHQEEEPEQHEPGLDLTA